MISVQLHISPESLNYAGDLCMLSAFYEPAVYPNPRFMKWQDQPLWHVFCTPLQRVGASKVSLTGHELNAFCNEQFEWGIFRLLCRMPLSWSQRPRMDGVRTIRRRTIRRGQLVAKYDTNVTGDL